MEWNFFWYEHKLYMIEYNPTKFHNFPTIFRDFMGGGMFCPPRAIIPQESPG